MPKRLCSCGETLNFSPIPNPIEWRIISDVELDQFSGMVNTSDIIRASKILAICPDCGRVYIFWNGFSQPAQEYIPVDDEG